MPRIKRGSWSHGVIAIQANGDPSVQVCEKCKGFTLLILTDYLSVFPSSSSVRGPSIFISRERESGAKYPENRTPWSCNSYVVI